MPESLTALYYTIVIFFELTPEYCVSFYIIKDIFSMNRCRKIRQNAGDEVFKAHIVLLKVQCVRFSGI